MHTCDNAHQTHELLTYTLGCAKARLHLWKLAAWRFLCRGPTADHSRCCEDADWFEPQPQLALAQRLCQTVWRLSKMFNRTILWPGTSAPRDVPKRHESIWPHKGERVTGKKVRGLQTEEMGCKCQCFASSGQSIGVSTLALVLPMNIQDWFPLGWAGWIPLQSKGLSRVFSNSTVQKLEIYYVDEL